MIQSFTHKLKTENILNFILYMGALTIGMSFIGKDESFIFSRNNVKDSLSLNPKCISRIDSFTKTKVYENVDLEPRFPGGPSAFARFLNRNLVYPKSFEDEQFQSSVIINFIVKMDGSLTDIHVNGKRDGKSISALERSVMELYKKMPNWTPGKCNGKNVSVRLKRPITICLSSD